MQIPSEPRSEPYSEDTPPVYIYSGIGKQKKSIPGLMYSETLL